MNRINSNITFRSNVYVNESGKIADKDFVSNVREYYALEKISTYLRVNGTSFDDQQATIRRNAPKCTLDRSGDLAWGTTIGSNGKYVCRCERELCSGFGPMRGYTDCSKLIEFQKIVRYKSDDCPLAVTDVVPSWLSNYLTSDEAERYRKIVCCNKVSNSERLNIVEIDDVSDKSLDHFFTYEETIDYASEDSNIVGLLHNEDKDLLVTVNRENGYVINKYEKTPRLQTREEFEISRSSILHNPSTIHKEILLRNKEIVEETILRENNDSTKYSIGVKRNLKNLKNSLFFRKKIEDAPKNVSHGINGTYSQSEVYSLVNSADSIIQSRIEDRILVNAGPGTGKTHTVIQRLAYILKNNLANPKNILVLCYSRSAVSVIKSRLENELSGLGLDYSLDLLKDRIRTLDSFATFLLDDGENRRLFSLDYDGRIRLFIRELENAPGTLNLLEYLIIDEVQDIVKDRARMLMSIINHVDCGYLLLGDKCQSIYDYSIKHSSEIDSKKFYSWLEKMPDGQLKKYEMVRNFRQIPRLSNISDKLRKSILEFTPDKQNDDLSGIINAISRQGILYYEDDLSLSLFTDFSALLSRTNAQTAHLSTVLHSKGVDHDVYRGSQYKSIPLWIARVFKDVTHEYMSRQEFTERCLLKGIHDVETYWSSLKEIDAWYDCESINVNSLKKALSYTKDVSKLPDESCEKSVILSTVHKAKGKEFTHVFLNKSLINEKNYNNAKNRIDEFKIAYVALTRAKEKLDFIKSDFVFAKNINGRPCGKLNNYSDYSLRNILIGDDQDLDFYSFVDGDDYSAELKQKQIELLQNGDFVDIILACGKYNVMFNNVIIGRLSEKFKSDLLTVLKHYQYPDGYWPSAFSNVCITKVVTIVHQNVSEYVPAQYRKSGFWHGFEIYGFATMHWE